MTNKERDEILISLVKGLNSLQVTVNEMRTEMKNMATKEEISKFVTKDEIKEMFEEQNKMIRSEVVDAIKELSKISYKRYIELKERIISNENEIKEIKLAIAN